MKKTIQESFLRLKSLLLVMQKRCMAYPSPLDFLDAAALINYLAKLSGKQQHTGKQQYIDYIKAYFPEKYRLVKYNVGEKQDLPEQMYYILRCGIVHSFSFKPTNQEIRNGGRSRSIIICHKKEALEKGRVNLQNYQNPEKGINDAILFIAEDFLIDIEYSLNKLQEEIEADETKTATAIDHIEKHPFISGGF